MRKIWEIVILISVLLVLVMLGDAYGRKLCKESVILEVGRGEVKGDDVESVCKAICVKGLHKAYENTFNKIEVGYVKYSATTYHRSNEVYCYCLYSREEGGEEEEIPIEYGQCVFVFHGGSLVKAIRFYEELVGSNVPAKLVKFFTFSGGEGTGIEKIDIAIKTITNVYYKGVYHISSYYALILIGCLFILTLFVFGFSNFYQILKMPSQFWSMLTGTDFKAKAMQVIAAVIFFSLPVKTEIPLEVLGQWVYKDGEGVVSDSRCRDALEYFGRIRSAYEECLRDCASNPELCGIRSGSTENLVEVEVIDYVDGVFIDGVLSGKEIENFCKSSVRYEEVRRYTESVCSYDLGMEEPGIFKIEGKTLREKGFYIPLAVSLVQGFVNFGLEVAERISTWSTDSIMTFLQWKLVKDHNSFANTFKGIQTQLRSWYGQAVISEMKLPESVVSDCLGMEGSVISDLGSVCSGLRPENVYEVKRGYCSEVIKSLDEVCQFARSIEDIDKVILSEIAKLNEDVRRRYEFAFDSAVKNFGFLSSVIVPVVAITYPFSVINQQVVNVVIAENIADQSFKRDVWSFLDRAKELARAGIRTFSGNLPLDFASAIKMKTEADQVTILASQKLKNELVNLPEFAYFMGYSAVMTSLPPGSFIYRSTIESLESLGKAVMPFILVIGLGLGIMSLGIFSLLKTKALIVGMAILGSIGYTLGTHIVEFLIHFFARALAVNIASMVLLMLPFLAIFIAGIIRFVHYCYEVLKVMITLPFYALPIATRRTEGAFLFLGDLMKLSVIPMLLASGMAFAVGFILIIEYFIYDLPIALVINVVSPSSTLNMYVFGVLSAILRLLMSLFTIYLGFRITFGFVDYVTNSIGRLFQFAVSGEGKEVGFMAFRLLQQKFGAQF